MSTAGAPLQREPEQNQTEKSKTKKMYTIQANYKCFNFLHFKAKESTVSKYDDISLFLCSFYQHAFLSLSPYRSFFSLITTARPKWNKSWPTFCAPILQITAHYGQ